MQKVAWVTGSSRNIGRSIAVALAKSGYDIACFARRREMLEETAEMIVAEGRRATVHVGDAGDDTALEHFAQEAFAEHGRVDAVINNAGITHEAKVADITPEQFRQIMDVNLVAYYTLSRAAYPFLCQSGEGVIVNIGSVYGSLGVPYNAPYCTSKAAIEGLTRSLAREWARDHIRVVCVAPGYVKTDMLDAVAMTPELEKLILGRIPLKRLAQPQEIADFVVFLASPKASFITGQTLVADGGQLMSV